MFLKKTVSIRSVMGVLSTAKATHHTNETERNEEDGKEKGERCEGGEGKEVNESDLVAKFDLPMLLANFGKKKYAVNDVIQTFDSEVACVCYVVRGPLIGKLFRYFDEFFRFDFASDF